MSYEAQLAAHYRGVRERLLRPPVRFAEPAPPPPVQAPRRTIPPTVADQLTRRGEQITAAILTPRERTKRLSVKLVVHAVARFYDLPYRDLLSARRTRDVVRPRQVAMWLAKRLLLASLPHIGRCIGGRDHTTALHGVRTIERLRLEDAQLAHDLEQLEAELRPAEEEAHEGQEERRPERPAQTAGGDRSDAAEGDR